MSKLEKVNTAYAELEQAVVVFKAAIAKFNAVYDPQTVGLDYWAEGLDDTMFEISEDIAENLE